MDPCPFVRLIVESLALKPPMASKSAGPEVHPSTTPCFCTLQLQDHPSLTQTALLPLATPSTTSSSAAAATSKKTTSAISAARHVFSLDPATLQKVSGKPAGLVLSVYAGRTGSTCGCSEGRLLGRVRVRLDLEAAQATAMVMQNGWVSLGDIPSAARLHLVVRSEPDPRFMFQFGGEPECNPVVYQVHVNGGSHSGPLRQPVFSCLFSADRQRIAGSR